jgi:hypothetical protein
MTAENDNTKQIADTAGSDSKRLVMPSRVLCSFDGMCWPNATEEINDLEWELRYGHPDRSDYLLAATICAAYRELVTCPKNKRDYVVRELAKIRAA